MRWTVDKSRPGKLVLTGSLGTKGWRLMSLAVVLIVAGIILLPTVIFSVILFAGAILVCVGSIVALKKSFLTFDAHEGFVSLRRQGAREERIPLTELDQAFCKDVTITVGSYQNPRDITTTRLMIKKRDGTEVKTNRNDAGTGNDEEARDQINAFLNDWRAGKFERTGSSEQTPQDVVVYDMPE